MGGKQASKEASKLASNNNNNDSLYSMGTLNGGHTHPTVFGRTNQPG